jgi:hypothetical protein
MKTLILLASILSAGFAWAAQPHWDELEPESTYKLAADIKMAPGVTLLAWHPLTLLQIESLGSAVLFKFNDIKCADPKLKTEMIFFNVGLSSDDDNSVGMEYAGNCEINVYVEPKNYYDRSIFR